MAEQLTGVCDYAPSVAHPDHPGPTTWASEPSKKMVTNTRYFISGDDTGLIKELPIHWRRVEVCQRCAGKMTVDIHGNDAERFDG